MVSKKREPQLSTHDATATKSLTSRRPRQAYIFLAIILLAAFIGVGMWSWMNGKNSQLVKQKDELSSKLTTLQASLKSLTSERDKLKNENTTLRQTIKALSGSSTTDPSLEIVESRYYNGPLPDHGANTQIFYDSHGLLLITIKVANNSSKQSYFNVGDLKLKSAGGVTYPYYTQSAGSYLSGKAFLPQGYTEIINQSLQVKEVVKGTLVFYIPDAIKNFVLTYNSQDFPINI